VDIEIEGDGKTSVREITELRDWLLKARLQDIQSVEQRVAPPKDGEMGAELIEVLQVVLAAPAVLALVSCIKRYIEARRPQTKITIKSDRGTVVIDTKNATSADLQDLARSLTPIAPAQ